MSPRRAFTREFKVEAVSLVTQQGLSVAEASRRLADITSTRTPSTNTAITHRAGSPLTGEYPLPSWRF